MKFDLSNAWNSGHKIVEGAISLLPNLAVAVVIFVLFIMFASFARSVVRRILQRRHKRQSIEILLGQLTYLVVVILGFLVALAVVAPSFRVGNLIGALGIGSVAIGFAFQNILQNFLAGILLLLDEPFKLGDVILVNGLEGTVEDIQTRATIVSTTDGKRIVIPNAVLFTSPVTVNEERKIPSAGSSPSQSASK